MDFAAIFVTQFVGHSVGDHWVQTSHQATHKSLKGWTGHLACLKHVATLQITKLAFLLPLLFLGIDLDARYVVAGMLLDGITHFWADKRRTLKWLADKVGRGTFYNIDLNHPVGSGQYSLDQSFHYFFVYVSSFIIAWGSM